MALWNNCWLNNWHTMGIDIGPIVGFVSNNKLKSGNGPTQPQGTLSGDTYREIPQWFSYWISSWVKESSGCKHNVVQGIKLWVVGDHPSKRHPKRLQIHGGERGGGKKIGRNKKCYIHLKQLWEWQGMPSWILRFMDGFASPGLIKLRCSRYLTYFGPGCNMSS